jgi:hypothetical protein
MYEGTNVRGRAESREPRIEQRRTKVREYECTGASTDYGPRTTDYRPLTSAEHRAPSGLSEVGGPTSEVRPSGLTGSMF